MNVDHTAVGGRTRLFTEFDVQLLRDIIEDATRAAGDSGGAPLTLLQVLRSYDSVLRTNDLVPSEDTFYYHTLLRLSLNQEDNWFTRLDREIEENRKNFATSVDEVPVTSVPHVSEASPGLRQTGSPGRLSVGQLGHGGGGSGSRSAHSSRSRRRSPAHTHERLETKHGGSHPAVEVLASEAGDLLRSWYTDSSGSPLPGGSSGRRRVNGGGSARSRARRSSRESRSSRSPDRSVLFTSSRRDASGATYGTSGAYFDGSGSDDSGESPHRSGAGRSYRYLSARGGDGVRGDYGSAVKQIKSQGYRGEPAHPASFHNFRVLAHGFRAWSEAVETSRHYKREHERAVERWMSAVRHWEMSLLGRYLLAWRQVVDDRIAAWEELADEHERRNLRLAWQHFRDAFFASRRLRVGLVRAVDHWAVALQQRVLRHWRRTAVSRKPTSLFHPTQIWAAFKWLCLSVPDRGEALMYQSSAARIRLAGHEPLSTAYMTRAEYIRFVLSQHSLRTYVLRRWTPRPTRLFLLERANAVLDARLLAHIFGSWASRTQVVLDMRTRTEQSELQRVFTSWRKIARVMGRLRARTDAAAAARAQRGLRNALRRWHLRTAFQKQLRDLGVELEVMQARHKARRVLLGWKAAWLERLALKERVAEAMMHRERYLRRRILLGWRQVAHSSVKARKFARLLAGKGLRLSFGLWHDYLVERRRKNALKRRAAEWNRRWVLLRHITEWSWYVSAWRRARNLETRLLSGAALRSWRDYTAQRLEKKRVMNLVKSHFESCTTTKWFNMWKLQASVQRAQRHNLMAAVYHAEESLVKRCYSRWHIYVSLKRKLRDAMARAQENHLLSSARRGLRRWHIRTQKARERREMSADASYLYVSTTLVRVLHDWKDAVEHQKRSRRAFAIAMEHHMGATKAGVMHRWRRFTDETLEWQANQLEAMLTHFLRRRFLAWRESFLKRRHAEQLRHKVVSRIMNATLSRVWMHWAAFAKEQKRLKHEMSLMFGARSRRTQHRVLLAWQGYIRFRRNKALMRLRADRHYFRVSQERALDAWLQAFAVRTRGHAVEQMVRERILRRTLERWQERKAQEEHHRDVIARCVHRMQSRVASMALNGWKGYTARKLHLRALQAEMEARVARIRVNAYFIRWRDEVARRVVNRAKMRAFLNSMMHKGMMRCFFAWQGEWQRNKHNQAVLRPVLARLRGATLARSFAAWKARHEDIVYKKEVFLYAAEQWQHARAGRALRQWLDWTRARIARREATRRAVMLWQNVTLGGAFHGWAAKTRAAVEARSNAARMIAHWQNQCVAAAFDSWYQFHVEFQADQEREVRAARLLRHWQNGHVARAFESWRDLVIWRRESREKVAHAVRVMLHRVVARSFNAWGAYTAERIERKEAVANAIKHWQNRKAVSFLLFWRDWASEAAEHRQAIRRALGHWNGGTKARCFTRWVEFAQESRHERRRALAAVGLWRNSTLARCLATWAANVAELKYEKHCVARAVQMFRGNVVAKCFLQWLAYTDSRLAKKETMALALKKWQQAKARAALQRLQWFAAARIERRAAMRRAGAAFANRTVRMAFNSWSDHVAMMKKARWAAARFQMAAAARSFVAWRAFVSTRQHHRHVLARMVHSRLFKILRAWRAAVEEEKQVSGQLTATMMKLAGWQTEAVALNCFNAWRDEAELSRKMRLAAERAFFGTLRKVFTAWRDDVRHTKVLDAVAIDVQRRWNLLTVRRCLRTWVDDVEERKRQRALMIRVLSRLCNSFVSSAWRSWHDLLLHHRKIAHMMQRVMGNLRSRTFYRWQELTVKRKHARFAEQVARRNYLLGVQRRAWQEWRRRAGVMRRVANLIGNRELATATRCFATWKEVVDHEKWERDAVQRFLSFCEGEAMGRSKSYSPLPIRATKRWRCVLLWKAWHCWWAQHDNNKRIKLKMLAAMRHSDEFLLRKCVNNWHARVLEAQSVQVAATYFGVSVKSRCFRSLQQYVWLRHHHASLLAHAEEHFKTSRASRALAHWRKLAAVTAKRRRAEAAIYANRCKRMWRVYWEAWRLVVTAARVRRLQTMQAYAHACETAQRRVFIAWAGWTGLRRERIAIVAHKAARLRLLTALAHFRGWYEVTHYRRLLRLACQDLAVRCMATRLRIRLGAWRDYAQRVRWCHRAARTFHTMSLLSFGFSTWHSALTMRKRYDMNNANASNLAEVLFHRRVRLSFTEWAKLAHQSKVARVKYAHFLSGSVVPRVFSAWVSYKEGARQERERLHRVYRHWSNRLLSRSFENWLEYHNHCRAERERLRLVLAHWQHKTYLLCFSAWAHWTQRRLRNEAAVHAAHERHKRRVKAKVFRSWHEHQVHERDVRERVLRLMSDHDSRRKHKSFAKWKEYYDHRLRHRDALVMADKHFSTQAKLRGVRCWVRYVSDALHNQRALKRAMARWTMATVSRCFQGWAEHAHEQRLLKEKARRAVQHFMNNKAVRALNHWRDWTATQMHHRHIIEAVAGRMRNRTAAAAFNSWTLYTEESKEQRARLALAIEGWRTQQQRAAVYKWHAWWIGRKEARAKVAKLMRRSMEKGKQQIFFAWRDYTSWARACREKCEGFAAVLASRTLSSVFSRWVEWWEEELRNKEAERRAANWFARLVYGKYFEAWFTEYDEQKKLRHAMSWWTNASLVRTFSTWREHVRVRKIARMLVSRNEECKTKYFDRWATEVAHRKHGRELRRKALAMFRNRTLVMYFHLWRTRAQTMQTIRSIFGRGQERELRHRFQRWAQWTAQRKHLHQAGNALRLLTGQASARVIWDSWRMAYHIAVHARQALTRRWFRRWAGFIRLKRAKRRRIEWAASYLGKGRAQRSFVAWRDITKASIDYRAHLKRLHEFRLKQEARRSRWRRRTLSTILLGWQKWAARTRLTNNLCAQFRFMKGPAKYFAIWASQAKEQRLLREKVALAVGLSNDNLRRRYLWKLSEAARDSRAERVGTALAQEHFEFMLRQRQFHVWSDFARKQAGARAIWMRVTSATLANVLSAWRRETRVAIQARRVTNAANTRTMQSFFDLWAACWRQSKRLRVAELLASDHFAGATTRRYFDIWADNVAFVITMREKVRANLVKVFKGDKRRRFDAWLEFVDHARKLRAAAHLFSNSTRRRCFAALKHAVKQARAERLMVFHVQRRATVAMRKWKEYSAWSRSTRRKLQDHLLHVRFASKAGMFDQWRQFAVEAKQLRIAGDRADKYYRRRLVGSAFDALAANADAWRARDAEGRELAASFFEVNLLARYFASWKTQATLQAKFRAFTSAGAEEMAGKKNRTMLRAVLEAWRDVAARRKKAAALIARHPAMHRRRMFDAWKQYVSDRMGMRIQKKRADEWYSFRLLSGAFVAWRGASYSELVHETARRRWEEGEGHVTSINEVLGLAASPGRTPEPTATRAHSRRRTPSPSSDADMHAAVGSPRWSATGAGSAIDYDST